MNWIMLHKKYKNKIKMKETKYYISETWPTAEYMPCRQGTYLPQTFIWIMTYVFKFIMFHQTFASPHRKGLTCLMIFTNKFNMNTNMNVLFPSRISTMIIRTTKTIKDCYKSNNMQDYRNWPRYGLCWSGWYCNPEQHELCRPAGTTSAVPDCSTNHDSADHISGQFLFYHDHNLQKVGKLAFSTSCTAVRPHRRLRNDAWWRDR